MYCCIAEEPAGPDGGPLAPSSGPDCSDPLPHLRVLLGAKSVKTRQEYLRIPPAL